MPRFFLNKKILTANFANYANLKILFFIINLNKFLPRLNLFMP